MNYLALPFFVNILKGKCISKLCMMSICKFCGLPAISVHDHRQGKITRANGANRFGSRKHLRVFCIMEIKGWENKN